METPPIVACYGRQAGGAKEDSWEVCVVPNLYPVLDDMPRVVPPRFLEPLQSCAATGQHEVVIESPSHKTRVSQLSAEQMRWMLIAYRDRMCAMRDAGAKFALAMKNSGLDAGASLAHSHSQIFGLPFVPVQINEELRGSRTFFEETNQCVFCHLLDLELDAGQRIVAITDDFVAWCPFASRFEMEIWVAPRRHLMRFEESDDETLGKLGELMLSILTRMEQRTNNEAFNYMLHSAPFDMDRDDHYHWHIEITPRISKAGGFEWGTGVHINTVTPERAAGQLHLDT